MMTATLALDSNGFHLDPNNLHAVAQFLIAQARTHGCDRMLVFSDHKDELLYHLRMTTPTKGRVVTASGDVNNPFQWFADEAQILVKSGLLDGSLDFLCINTVVLHTTATYSTVPMVQRIAKADRPTIILFGEAPESATMLSDVLDMWPATRVNARSLNEDEDVKEREEDVARLAVQIARHVGKNRIMIEHD